MKTIIKNNIKFIIVVLVCIFSSILVTYATGSYLFNSSDVEYNNTNSGLDSTNVSDAIDELYHHATDYNEIKTIIGNSTLTTTSQTLTGAVNEVNDQIGTSETACTITSTYKRTDSYVYKINNLCIFVAGTFKGLTVDNYVTVGSLPNNCKPINSYASSSGTYGANYTTVRLNHNGTIEVNSHEVNSYVSVFVVYLTS